MNSQSTQHSFAAGLSRLLLLLTFLLTTSSHAQGLLDKAPDLITEAELWQEYYGWRQAGDIFKAHEAALQLMSASATRHGQKSAEFGSALGEVGVTEVLLERYDDALLHLTKSEDILHDQLPLYSEKLISPLTFLGSALQSAGRHEDALDAFSEAQHITHRLWGTHNREQIRIAYAKADSAQALGDPVQAEALHRHAYKLHRINYGETSPQAIEASARLGTWLRSTGEYLRSINHFHQSLTELQGDGPGARRSFEQALSIDPELSDAHYHLGHLLQTQGEVAAAATHFRGALQFDPEMVLAANALAWILATAADVNSDDASEALGLAQRAAAATRHEQPQILGTLAAAHAASGQFDEAVRWQTRALELAPAAQRDAMQRMLDLYRSGKPYRR